MLSSDDDWGFVQSSPLQEMPQKKIHRISSTSTIKSLLTESVQASPKLSAVEMSELNVIAKARLQLISKPLNFNIIVLGDSNIGKTSLIHTILAKNFNEIAPELLGQKALYPTRNILDNIGVVSNEETELRVNLIDTPGYGFFTSKEKWVETIVSFISKQAKGYKSLKKVGKGENIEDIRVHIALYMIEGPRCKEADLEMMYTLQKYVNIIPLIARADAYSASELTQVKLQMLSQSVDAKIVFFDVIMALKENINELDKSLLAPIPPFAVISGGNLLRTNEKNSFVRRYSWGLCDLQDNNCSDFNILCKLLFGHFVIPAISASKALNKANSKKLKKIQLKKKSTKLNSIQVQKMNWIAGVVSKFLLRMI